MQRALKFWLYSKQMLNRICTEFLRICFKLEKDMTSHVRTLLGQVDLVRDKSYCGIETSFISFSSSTKRLWPGLVLAMVIPIDFEVSSPRKDI